METRKRLPSAIILLATICAVFETSGQEQEFRVENRAVRVVDDINYRVEEMPAVHGLIQERLPGGTILLTVVTTWVETGEIETETVSPTLTITRPRRVPEYSFGESVFIRNYFEGEVSGSRTFPVWT